MHTLLDEILNVNRKKKLLINIIAKAIIFIIYTEILQTKQMYTTYNNDIIAHIRSILIPFILSFMKISLFYKDY